MAATWTEHKDSATVVSVLQTKHTAWIPGKGTSAGEAPASPEEIGRGLAALDNDERWQALRAAGISAVVRAPTHPIEVRGRPVLWSEISVTVGGGGGASDGNGDATGGNGRPLTWTEVTVGGGPPTPALAAAQARAEVAEQAAAVARAEQARTAQARDDACAALVTVAAERDQARGALADARCAVTAAVNRERDAQCERDRLREERDTAISVGREERAELATLRAALSPATPFVTAVDQPGPAACVVAEDSGGLTEVRRGGPVGAGAEGLVRINGGAWVWLSSILLAARRAGALP